MVRFSADAMLGRLAKWLRLLGFDTLYSPDITDRRLLQTAKEEGRIILTRDTHFLGMKLKDCLFITSNDTFQQLEEVITGLSLNLPDTMRCVSCNGLLFVVANKEDIAHSVPEYVYLNFNRFSVCKQCGHIYWEGSQFRSFREKLKEIIKEGPGTERKQ